MTSGSSGGGWLVDVASGFGKINGVMSYSYDDIRFSHSPYQGDDALELYNSAKKVQP